MLCYCILWKIFGKKRGIFSVFFDDWFKLLWNLPQTLCKTQLPHKGFFLLEQDVFFLFFWKKKKNVPQNWPNSAVKKTCRTTERTGSTISQKKTGESSKNKFFWKKKVSPYDVIRGGEQHFSLFRLWFHKGKKCKSPLWFHKGESVNSPYES